MKKILPFILFFVFNCAMAQDYIIENKNAPSSPSYLLDKRNIVVKTKKTSEKEFYTESLANKTNEPFTHEKQPGSEKASSSNLSNRNKVDWRSYMRKVDHSVKAIWTESFETVPDKACDNKTVVFFKIHKDGSASDYKVVVSSGNTMQDEIAINSIKQAAPFEKLPLNFDKDSIDTEFNFVCYSLYPSDKTAKPALRKSEHFHSK